MEETNLELIYKYIKLDSITDIVSNPNNIDIRLSEISSNNNYIIYDTIPIKDIDIVMTNSHRIDEPYEKLEKMKPLEYYLDEKNKEEYIMFKHLLVNTSIDDIKEVENSQKLLTKQKPITIKYHKDYLWQIFYIKRTNRYYMIVPTQETEQQAFLYLLKKKIAGNKGSIYVPICNGIYENEIIDEPRIKKLETSLNYFTNYWPTIYESKNDLGKKIITIIGKLKIYENIISDYKMEFTNKDDINTFYTLVDKLFYLQTELSGFFIIDILLNEKGRIHFYYNDMELTTDNLEDFYKEEIEKNIKSINDVEKIQNGLFNKLNKLRIEEKKLNSELLNKQKQISTFLECRKTFFGKIKYYFKHTKKIKNKASENEIVENNTNIEKPIIENNSYNNDIDDLIYVCKQLRSKTILATTTRMDTQNLSIKIDILKKKIENANSYIKEIESHKRSIFEFWKFTNKDEKAQLIQAENTKQENKNKIERVFNLTDDLKEFSKKIDLLYRKNLSNYEINSVLLTKTDVLEDINDLITSEKITSKVFEKIINNKIIINIDENALEHREKIKTIDNILGISKNSTFDEYLSSLKKNIKYLERALKQSTINMSFPTYSLKPPDNKILRLELNMNNYLNEKHDKKHIKLYRINLKSGTHIIPFTNIVFFNNRNETLPLGMDYSTQIIADLRKEKILKIKEKVNHIIDLNNNKVTKLNIIEYNV